MGVALPVTPLATYALVCPSGTDWLAWVEGAISYLTLPAFMEGATAELARSIAVYPLTGQIAFTVTEKPANTLWLDGTTHSASAYPALWDALPHTWKTAYDFTLPNLADHYIRVGSPATLPSISGSDTVTLTIDQLPLHGHDVPAHTHDVLPHDHGTLPHTHADGIALPSLADFGTGAPVPSAIPSVGTSSPTAVVVLPSVVDIVAAPAMTTTGTGAGEPISIAPLSISLRAFIYT